MGRSLLPDYWPLMLLGLTQAHPGVVLPPFPE